MSVLFMARFRRYMNEFCGYVISDEYYGETESQDKQIYKLSEIDGEVPLIVAMTGKVAVQVISKLRDRKKCAVFIGGAGNDEIGTGCQNAKSYYLWNRELL